MRIVFVVFLCLLPKVALADGETLSPKGEELLGIARDAERESTEKAKRAREPKESVKEVSVAKGVTDPSATISSLLDEVNALKNKVVVTKRNALATNQPKNSKFIGSKTVYPFIEGRLYEVRAGVDKVTDVALEPGERLTNTPMAGDTVRWKVGLLSSGSGDSEVPHVIVKPLEEELETNLILTTDRRVYHLRLLSSDFYMPSVSWSYPEREEKSLSLALKRKEEEQVSLPPEKLRFEYTVEGKKYDWKPELVFDDGSKTYLRMPETISSAEAPALFVLDESDEPLLVNYRVKGRFYIVDRVFDRAELRVGAKSKVTVYSPRYERGFFERNF